MVNRVLEPLNEILKHEKSHQFLEILDEDDLPTNSDVVLIFSQYRTALHGFRDKYYKTDEYKKSNYGGKITRWMTAERPPEFYKS